MSELTKVPHTKNGIRVQVGDRNARLFIVPRDRANGIVNLLQDFEVSKDQQTISWRDSVDDLTQKYTESGVALKGARAKENLSQRELAGKLGIPQSHISDMECGRRTIGKSMAKRLAKVLKVGYKIFL
ncbi:MAG: helix-turn-helix transcriptional regulator [Oligoflexia bacterium]|nr:helix-turn-helix transcriptional regulator [Oligoflexia bacterium]